MNTITRRTLRRSVLGVVAAFALTSTALAADLAATTSWLQEHILAWNSYDDVKSVSMKACVLEIEKTGNTEQSGLYRIAMREGENEFNRTQHGENLFDVTIRSRTPTGIAHVHYDAVGKPDKHGNPPVFIINLSAKRGEGIPEAEKAKQIVDALTQAAQQCRNHPATESHQGVR